MEEKKEWITEVWEPVHQLELTTNDVKEDPLFKWFVDHIQIINDTTGILGIGKGLEQSMEAAEVVGERFYKLRTMSDTRFSAYFEGSIANFERNETNIAALKKRTESTDKQYDTFKKRFKDMAKAGGENEESEEIVKRFQEIIYSKSCEEISRETK